MNHADKGAGGENTQLNCVDEILYLIWAIGCDKDGCVSKKDLEELIDEIVQMSIRARECLWKGRLFGIHGSPELSKGIRG